MGFISFLLTIFYLGISFLASMSFASSVVPGELLVKYRAGHWPGKLQGGLAKIGWKVIRVVPGNTGISRKALDSDPNIVYIEPNYYGKFLSMPNDPSLDKQWYLENVSVLGAWEKSLGADVVIGLIDSGVDLEHEDLADNILPGGWDFGDDDDSPEDELGHGTQVCGVIAAIQNNGIGISGIAPKSRILPLKVNEGFATEIRADAVAEAILYAADWGVRIINLSLGWGYEQEPQVIIDAINYAIEKGVVLVAGAGNDNGSVWFPANLDEVIAVSAIDEDSEKLPRSAFGPDLDLVAPGINIRTTAMNSQYIDVSGTSFSAPIVSAVAALLLSDNRHLRRDQVRDYLTMRADDLGEEGKDEIFGYGKVNALTTLDPLVSFVFPPKIRGSRIIPLVYLLAIFGDGTHFLPLKSRVSFSSEFLTPIGPPVIAFPEFLLQPVILGICPPQEVVSITVITGTEEIVGYRVLSTGLFFDRDVK